MKLKITVIVSFGILLLVGCSSKDLTRSKAAAIITRELHFPQPVALDIKLGRLAVGELTFDRFVGDNSFYKKASDQGLLTMAWQGTQTTNAFFVETHGLVTLELTDQGRKLMIGNEVPASGQGMGYTPKHAAIKLCEKEFDDVTGITALGPALGNISTVEYQWKFGNLTPLGKAEAATCGSLEPHKESVAMQLYDDGWRLTRDR